MHYVCFHYEFEHGDTDVDAECGAGACPSRRVDLGVTLRGWADWDVAAFHLGRSIGTFERPDDFQRVKGTLWTENPVGISLHDCLLALAEAGVLERRTEPDEQFRWVSRPGVPR